MKKNITVLCRYEMEWLQLECQPSKFNEYSNGMIFPFSAVFCQLCNLKAWKRLLNHARCAFDAEHGSSVVQHFG